MKNIIDAEPKLKAAFADIGESFSENRIGEFVSKPMNESPAEAQEKMDAMRNDQNSDYYSNDNTKRQKAIAQMTKWRQIVEAHKR